ncbi:MAG: hypothetical protein O7C63_03455 [Alphaproteobacteria bacterium]|nr:hypothetical protein [Alphaproteobacteria bacterium]
MAQQTGNLMSAKTIALVAALTGVLFTTSGCLLAAGAAIGAGGYELHQAKEMDRLDEEFEKGHITREEYLSRKKQIEQTAVFQ